MKNQIVLVLAAVSCLAGSAVASAAVITVVENGVTVASWEQSLTPTPLAYGATNTLVSVSDTVGLGSDNSVYWYTAAHGGGLSNDGGNLNIYGPVAFTGSTSAPVFTYGTFFGTDKTSSGTSAIPAIITISVPEPATWAMMCAGLGMIGLAVRRRQKVSVTYG